MTKTFEEELKNKEVEIFTHMDGCTISKKVCINYADVVNLSEGWVSPEEHQARVNELIEAKEKNIELLRKNSTLKSQLQQQALPVVPEFVGEWISEDIENNTVIEDILTIIITSDDKDLKEYGLWIKKNPATYVIARTLGFQVEKLQLFYLKNMLTGLNLVLEQSFNATGKHVGERFREFDMQYIATDEQEARLYKNTFSKAEIKNMDAGSYELVPVEDGE